MIIGKRLKKIRLVTDLVGIKRAPNEIKKTV